MIVSTNIASLTAQSYVNKSDNAMQKSLTRLSSGYRINTAADDAAGLAITEKMTSQINGLDQANRNAESANTMLQTAEGALSETESILQRMRELAVQSSSDTNTSADRAEIQLEVDDLIAEIDRISSTTQFNGMNLLDGTGGTSGTFTFQIGANEGQNMSVTFANMSASSLGVNSIDLGTSASVSTAAISTIDAAIQLVSNERAQIGAKENRLDHTTANLETASENLTTAKSTIKDTDMAAEMSEFTKQQVINQAGIAMLAQANSTSQNVLSLLQ
jgi:flagellin